MKDVVRNLPDAADKSSKVDSKECQSLNSYKMFLHSLDDPTIHFEGVVVITDMGKPTVGAGDALLQ